jgi:hypothetical protein
LNPAKMIRGANKTDRGEDIVMLDYSGWPDQVGPCRGRQTGRMSGKKRPAYFDSFFSRIFFSGVGKAWSMSPRL